MHRDMQKMLEEYNLRFGNGYNRKDRYYFTPAEMKQVYTIGGTDRFSLICSALYAGFVCGYHAAQMDARDQGKKAPQAPRIPRTMPGMYHDDDRENTLPF